MREQKSWQNNVSLSWEDSKGVKCKINWASTTHNFWLKIKGILVSVSISQCQRAEWVCATHLWDIKSLATQSEINKMVL